MQFSSLARYVRFISWTVVILVMILAAVLVVVRWRGYELLSVQSDSMRPVIAKGDAILVDRRIRTLEPGMVATYRSPDNPQVMITHRVIAVDRERGVMLARGDAARADDPLVPLGNVQGRVRAALPMLGVGLDGLKHPLGLAAAIYLPVLAIIVGEVQRLAAFYAQAGRRPAKRYVYVLHYYARG